MQLYLRNGASPEKLVLGIPTYGRAFKLISPDATEIGSPSDGSAEAGKATREKGFLAYYEVKAIRSRCNRVNAQHAIVTTFIRKVWSILSNKTQKIENVYYHLYYCFYFQTRKLQDLV